MLAMHLTLTCITRLPLKQLSKGAVVGLSPVDVIKRVTELTQKLRVVQGMDELSKEAQHNATLMFFSLLRCMLASRRVLEEHKLTDRSFNWLLGEVETRFNQVGTQNPITEFCQSRGDASVLIHHACMCISDT